MFKRCALVIAAVLLIFVSLTNGYTAEKDNLLPKVISTSPQNAAKDVDPSLNEISVTFNEPMMDKSWSWSYEDKNKFPQMTAEPYYTDNYTKCVLPVKLEPNKEYVIWINTARFKNFKDKAGNPAEPYRFTFKTR
jgi:hypothetical protein